MKRLLSCFLLAIILAVPASAAAIEPFNSGFVPDTIVTENLNGRQMVVKTYNLAPDDDAAALKEEPFELEGYRYTFAEIVQEEHRFNERKLQTQTVTVETSAQDMTTVLAALEASVPYDDGTFQGTLMLDHTSIQTEAAGYTTKSYTITETKQIGGLDRNDPSYVPATTVKNGKTLSLSDVSWSEESAGVTADGAVITSSYMATATYKGTGYQKLATGYITTAHYTGEVVSSGISGITYTLTYLGEPLPMPLSQWLPYAMIGVGVFLVAAAVLLFFLLRQHNVNIYTMPSQGGEYVLADKQRLRIRKPVIDLRDLDPLPTDEAVIEIKHRAAHKLFGRLLTIRLDGFVRTHLIEQLDDGDYWFRVSTIPDEELLDQVEKEETQ